MGPGTVSLVTCSGCFRRITFVICVCPLVIVEPWLLLACQWVRLSLKLTGYDIWPDLQLIGCYSEALPYWLRFTPAGSRVCWDCPLCVQLVGLFEQCSVVVWSQAPSVLVLGPLQRDFSACPGHTLLVTIWWLSSKSYKVILSFSLPVISLEACKKDHNTNWGQLPLLLGLR